jgi:DNA modification methylase
MKDFVNQILCGDCVEILGRAGGPFADFVFADPPFNIGYAYDQYDDTKGRQKYLAWSRQWIGACVRVLKPEGSFYIAIGDDYAAHLRLIAEDEFGLTLRNWIICHYSFGQQTKNKFARAHTHILYFVRDPKNFTFNDAMVRVISDRQKKYRDKRANPAGKMPDDVWNEYPRVCGTFTERTGFPCQMPESLLARIIRVSSNEGDWALDPFCGSGTTAVVAHRLRRMYTSIDVSATYVRAAKERIARSDAPLGPFGPSGPSGKGLKDGKDRKKSGEFPLALGPGGCGSAWPEQADLELRWLYGENKIARRPLCESRFLLSLFTQKFNDRLGAEHPYTTKDVSERLTWLERSGKLSPFDVARALEMGAAGVEE